MYIENKQKISAIEKFFSNKIIINRRYIKINLVKKYLEAVMEKYNTQN